AVRRVDLEVRAGQAVALIGANGAGKSTTLRSLAGLHREAGGSVMFDGQEILGWRAPRVARRGLVLVPEGRQILGTMSVMENLALGRLALGNRGDSGTRELDQAFSLFPILHKRRTQLGGSLSGGEQQMLALARALMSRPKVLLLDEPSLGLAPQVVSQV